MRAVLSIGSNMDDRIALLRTVFADFADEIVAASGVYATPPWGNTEQNDFLNATLLVDVPLTPHELLRRGQALENKAERRRLQHWGPRTLDVDIVDVEGFSSADPELTVPHPFAHERAFVLVPWLEIEPDAVLAGQRVADIVKNLPAAEVAAITRLGTIEEL
ncbi:MAG: 2-amino-4-hydroxy-6-hydroxymethyldihydropteridine diphosphokinase [Corynebacterium sp.]|nr:2-amino-4-hydroxy-6-hydroxymethyldihydropteridine diphosphokinase [Corynebacterium sp.]